MTKFRTGDIVRANYDFHVRNFGSPAEQRNTKVKHNDVMLIIGITSLYYRDAVGADYVVLHEGEISLVISECLSLV